MKTSLYILLSACLLWQCKSLPQTKTVTVTKTVKVIERDTVITTQADSTYYKALIKCVDNQPVLMPAKMSRFKGALKPPKVVLKDTVLTVNCEIEARKIFLKWKEQYTTEHRQIEIIKPVKIPRQLTWWQTLWMTVGKVAVGVFLLIILYIILAWRLRSF